MKNISLLQFAKEDYYNQAMQRYDEYDTPVEVNEEYNQGCEWIDSVSVKLLETMDEKQEELFFEYKLAQNNINAIICEHAMDYFLKTLKRFSPELAECIENIEICCAF